MRHIAGAVVLVIFALAQSGGFATAGGASSAPFALPATFSGLTPCADCPGIRVTLSLAADGTYALKREYLDRNTTGTETGKWTFATATSQLRLLPAGENAQPELFSLDVNPALVMLDASGKPIPSGPSNVLSQVVKTAPFEGTDWNLVALGNQSYGGPAGERGASLHFEDGRVTGSSGCNRMTGSYHRSGANGLTFGPLATTRMACDPQAMQTEGAFLQALGSVASFSIGGSTLVLLDRSGAPVARLAAAF